MSEAEKKLAAMIAIALKVMHPVQVDAKGACDAAEELVGQLRSRGWVKALDL